MVYKNYKLFNKNEHDSGVIRAAISPQSSPQIIYAKYASSPRVKQHITKGNYSQA